MLSLSKLEQITELREKKLPIPRDNRFTQKTAIQIRIDEMNYSGHAQESELSQYAMSNHFKSDKHTNGYNNGYNNGYDNGCNNGYNSRVVDNTEEDEIFPNQEVVEEPVEDYYTAENKNSLLLFEENDTVDIPSFLKVLELDNEWYLYGTANPNSFYKALLYQTQPDIILKSNKERANFVNTFKQEIAIKVDDIYKKNNYKQLRFNRHRMTEELLGGATDITYPVIILVSDYLKVNICILDIVVGRYKYIKSSVETDNILFVVELSSVFLPLMHTSAKNFVSSDVISKVKKNFEMSQVPTCYKDRQLIKLVENHKNNIGGIDADIVVDTDNNVIDIDNNVIDIKDIDIKDIVVDTDNNVIDIKDIIVDTNDIVVARPKILSEVVKSKVRLQLKPASIMHQLPELQEMAETLGITSVKVGKTKDISKTKKELFDEITAFYN